MKSKIRNTTILLSACTLILYHVAVAVTPSSLSRMERVRGLALSCKLHCNPQSGAVCTFSAPDPDPGGRSWAGVDPTSDPGPWSTCDPVGANCAVQQFAAEKDDACASVDDGTKVCGIDSTYCMKFQYGRCGGVGEGGAVACLASADALVHTSGSRAICAAGSSS